MTHNISRRAVLAGMTMAGASPVLAQNLPTNPDIVIVGAGAAGLQAGRPPGVTAFASPRLQIS
mgnify:CR=1 FL=1